MYWFQDIESARALARLWSESPHPPGDDGAPQGNPDQLTPPVAAESAANEATAHCGVAAAVTAWPVR